MPARLPPFPCRCFTLSAALFLCLFSYSKDPPLPAGLTTTDRTPSAVSQPVLRTTLPASWDENWFASPVVGDLKGGQFGEIAICYSNKAAVYCHNGNMLPGWPVSFPNTSNEIRSIAACDLDNDRSCEILAVKTSDGPVTAIWNLSGAMRAGWSQVKGDSLNYYGGYNQNIGCTDLDKNGVPDIVCTYDICHIGIMKSTGDPWKANRMFKGEKDAMGNGKGGVQIWDVASAKKNILDWPTGRGDHLRTGDFSSRESP